MTNPLGDFKDSTRFSQKPVVLCFSGLDPSGGAGIQADIESLIATGCHATTIATCITAQNTQGVHSWYPVTPGMITQQARLIAEDMAIAAVKIGMIGTYENLEVITHFLLDHPHLPVVLDPVLSAGSGQTLIQQELHTAILEHLIPLTTLITPNSEEIRKLLQYSGDMESCAFQLLSRGCDAVCVTGGHLGTPKIRNRLWQDYQLTYDRCWNRIDGEFHGTGCTFASAAAGYIAQGMTMTQAVTKADEFTWQAISKAENKGKGQAIPNRSFLLNETPKRPVAKKSRFAH